LSNAFMPVETHIKTSTYFALLAEFGTGQIPLRQICEKYFGISERLACRRAMLQQLPVPAFHAGSQKSTWLIDAADLASHIDLARDKARNYWEAVNRGSSVD
jgi:hypothetical protein